MNSTDLPTWTLLNIGYALVDKDWTYKNVCSPFTRLYYVTDGSGEIIMLDGVVKLTPGHIYIIPAYTLHSTRCHKMMGHYYVHIHENTVLGASPTYEEWTFPQTLEADDVDLTIFKQLMATNPDMSLTVEDPKRYDTHTRYLIQLDREMHRPVAQRLLNNSMISKLMSRWFLTGEHRHEFVNQKINHAVVFLRSHFNSNIGVDQLADEAKMSRHHFSRLFKAETGLSIGNYLRHLRVRRAQVLLSHTYLSIREIGEQVGYEDYNYFIRIFRKETGITPSRYRQSMIYYP